MRQTGFLSAVNCRNTGGAMFRGCARQRCITKPPVGWLVYSAGVLSPDGPAATAAATAQRCRPVVASLVLMLLFYPALAQKPLSLDQAISIALANHPQIKAQDALVRLATSNAHPSFAGGYPVANITLNGNTTYNGLTNPASFLTNLDALSGGITPGADVSMVLYQGGSVSNNRQLLNIRQQEATLQLQSASQQLKTQVTQTYWQYVFQLKQTELLKQITALSRARLERQRIRFEYAQGTGFDTLQLREAYWADSISQTAAQLQLRVIKQQLDNLLNNPQPTDYVPADTLHVWLLPADYPTLAAEMLANNPAYRLALLQQEITLIGYRLAKAQRSVAVIARGSAAYNFNSNIIGQSRLANGQDLVLTGINTRNRNVGLQIGATFPIFDGGRLSRQIQNADIQTQVSRWQTEALKLRLTGQLATLVEQHELYTTQLKLTEDRLTNASLMLRAAGQRFDQGQISAIDYRAVQTAYALTEQTRLNLLYAIQILGVEIEQLLGR